MTETTTAPPGARLDRLPFTCTHLRVLTGSGTGWALDAMDVGLISFVIAALVAEWQLTTAASSWIASAGFAGMAVGATLGGLLADRIGRRSVFALTLLIYGLATGASALAGGLAALIALRFVVGLGLGAELPVASTYVSEFAPARMRGRVIVVLEAFWAVGWTASALIGYLVIPNVEDGWRWALAIGAIPAVYAIVVRWGLPESPRWLASRGRAAEAERVVADIERSPALFGTRRVEGAATAPASAVAASTVGERLRALWASRLRRRTASLWVVWFCVNFAYYGAFIWIPTLLYTQGYDLVRTFGFTLVITLAQLPGYAVAAWLIERWGRRATLSVFLAGSAVAALLFGQATTVPMILATGMALSFFNLGAWGALYAVTPESYPTSLRGTGAGWAAGVGRIASILAPPAVPLLQGVGGVPLVFVVLGAFFVVAAAATWGLADARGRSLEE
ncbi:MFS transporter [Microbacterium sp. EYE_5]|uniref:MFS transporter n=1 Tax=unclassified Microbacterium TaxID=2609290 RepID=UPI002006A0F0|nr:MULTISPECIES: MFS transporter [unclassified Microbacterium]MCK6080771.1 MFS transporter [Microbacterium sp. EYE_382]MCK6086042.1 MFS transporter [Microbacterium sp. EYE_384]MCK6124460.1 MFS transporter [Microbacterium sp. EYE_80]MCK6127369.1 MFS transporter [Microbacterium sp. EYE_79]MCK6141726.1 MFS transporter [Microbacterium sp. EYE_39]